MATVELARDTQLGRKVAVKRLYASLVGDETFQARFLREARLAAGLSHPNLVGVYDAGEENGVPYIVMEYVEGETLAELMRRTGPLPADRVVEILLQVCAGLEHAHAAGLVHRDIKPQNLLVRADGVVKIADFGIARTLQATQLTQAGTVLGTAAYLAPEQAAGEPVTAAADIYSLGAVAYELLTGRTPYQFESLGELLAQQRQPPSMAGVPPRLERAVAAALALDPSRRPTAAGLAQELAHTDLQPDEPTAPTEAMPRATRIYVPRRVVLAAAALLVALVVSAVLAVVYAREDTPAPAPRPARADTLPRGETPAETARLLADWLRDRSG
jgi:eukaryotic-like serine/threonine-protein kinase